MSRFAVVVPHCQLTQKAKKKYVSGNWECSFLERFGFHTFLIGRKRVAKKVTFIEGGFFFTQYCE